MVSDKIYKILRKKGCRVRRGRKRWRLPHKSQKLEHLTGSEQESESSGEEMMKSEAQSKNDSNEQQDKAKDKTERIEELPPESEGIQKEEHPQESTYADKSPDIYEKLGQEQERSEAQEILKEAQQKLEQCEENKAKRKRPNYFVAIPITNDQILDKIEDVQELVVTKEAKLLRALIPVEKVHITILVAHLPTAEDVKKAVSAMMQCEAKIKNILSGEHLNMIFHGVGQFNGQVIFVKMEKCQEQLSKIAESIVASFTELNIDIAGSKAFKPHLTFLKLSKAPFLRRKGFKKVCPALYEGYEDTAFGTEILTRIDLCAMQKKPQESGYYFCEFSICIATSTLPGTPELEMSCTDALSMNINQEGSASTNVASDSDKVVSSRSYVTPEMEFAGTSHLATKMECSTLGVPAEHETKTCKTDVVNQEELNQNPDSEKAVLFEQKKDLSMSALTSEQETRSRGYKEDAVEATSESMDTTETLEINSPVCRETPSQLQMDCSDNATYAVDVDLEGTARVTLSLEVVLEHFENVACTVERYDVL